MRATLLQSAAVQTLTPQPFLSQHKYGQLSVLCFLSLKHTCYLLPTLIYFSVLLLKHQFLYIFYKAPFCLFLLPISPPASCSCISSITAAVAGKRSLWHHLLSTGGTKPNKALGSFLLALQRGGSCPKCRPWGGWMGSCATRPWPCFSSKGEDIHYIVSCITLSN